MYSRERGYRLRRETPQRSLAPRERVLRKREGTPPLSAGSDDDREQLRCAERVRAEVLQALARPLGAREFAQA
jgi:hypothetical protein